MVIPMETERGQMKGYALRLPEATYDRLRNLAFFSQRSMNELITTAVTYYMDQVGDQEQLSAMAARTREEYREALDKLKDL